MMPTGDTGPMATLAVPPGITTFLFDLDGVLTETAAVHAAAWKEMFDRFLQARAERSGEAFVPFAPGDYTAHVDGRLRPDGVRGFLASRGITIPEGAPDDPPEAETVHGLGSRKNALLHEIVARDGVQRYEGSVRFAELARDAGYRRAVVSASRNCKAFLAAAGIEHLFEVRVDGEVAGQEGLRGKPAPDTFLAAAGHLRARPEQAAVFEDALAGVEAGRAGGFGWVVGVDRVGGDHGDALRERGADIVVRDLEELVQP